MRGRNGELPHAGEIRPIKIYTETVKPSTDYNKTKRNIIGSKL
jgi:hypothetical protein